MIVASIAGAVWWFSHTRYQAGYADANELWQTRLDEASEQGRDNVKEALDKERENQHRQRQEQNKRDQQARDEHHKAITAAQAEARTWHDRYRHALRSDSTCSTWSQEPVPCPL
jgi:hypothetical protein